MEFEFAESPDLWDAFVARSPHRSVFVTTKFLRSLGTPFTLVTCKEKGTIVAGAPILLDASGLPMGEVHRFTLYQGLLHEDRSDRPHHHRVKHELETTEAFVAALMARYTRCCLTLSWRFRDMRGFLWHHYHEPELGQCRLHHCHTGIIDLLAHATFESYLASIRQVRRQDYRKIDGIEFRDTDDVEALDALHERTFLRQGIDRHPSESGLLRSIARAALEGGYGRLAGAFVGGAPASLILFLYDDRTAYYMFAANDPDHRGGSASTALLLRLIQDAHACGFAEVDLMGMNSPKRGDYKLSFNADVQGYVTVTCGV